jgi:hypothetical protein
MSRLTFDTRLASGLSQGRPKYVFVRYRDLACVTTTTTYKQELWVKVDAEGCGKGQKLANYCLEVLNQVSSQVSKGYFCVTMH